MTTRTAVLFIIFVLLAFGMVVYDNLESRKAFIKVENEADMLGTQLIVTHAQKTRAEQQVQILTLQLKICELQTRIILENREAQSEKAPINHGLLAECSVCYNQAQGGNSWAR